MFKSAVVKLTASYLALLMVLSLCFSLAFYNVASRDVGVNLRRQIQSFSQFGLPPGQFDDYREAALADLHRHEIIELIRFNLIILLLGGGASYWLARRTLHPLEVAMEAQSRFTADASHELRTPLAALHSEIEVALREPKLASAEARQLLASNLEEVVKLEELSAGLLKVARYQAGQTKLTMEQLDITEPVEAAIGRVARLAHDRGMTIKTELTHVHLAAERASLTELIVTLLENAVKYGTDGMEITITTREVGHNLELTVADHGQGIAPADLPHIFERFYRADNSRTKNRTAGYGLGLSLALAITQLHHGTITVDSALDHGSVFRLRLPLAQPSPLRKWRF